PSQAYYGAQTARAVENFQISGQGPHERFVWAGMQIKKAAATVNGALGTISKTQANAICKAADEALTGKFHDSFVVDVYQAGAGTSHHMNLNEVLANRANEILGVNKRGSYSKVHPNDHVNFGQSTNDVIPTCIRLAALSLAADLIKEGKALARSFAKKSKQFERVFKSGRTHWQDATPVTLGQEWGGYSSAIEKLVAGFETTLPELREIGLGGTAVGSGINSHPRYRRMVAAELQKQTKLGIRPGKDYFERMQSLAPFVAVSGALRNLAQDLSRIANDLRLLSSGPKVGLAEFTLPPVQPGSSIMPGKVNPVMAEMTNMVCFQVLGNDQAILWAAQAGQMELNVMMPLVAWNLPQSFTILTNAMRALRTKCVDGVTANKESCLRYAMSTSSLVTVLNPIIGYRKAAEVFKHSLKTGETIPDVVVKMGLMSQAEVNKAFNLPKMVKPGVAGK
ncbi:MAG: aspartate ammonia-lyase, partial [Methyloligellaceae bacterium]